MMFLLKTQKICTFCSFLLMCCCVIGGTVKISNAFTPVGLDNEEDVGLSAESVPASKELDIPIIVIKGVEGEPLVDGELNGTGDGNTVDDIIISADCKKVSLRSERKGHANGCLYTVNLAVKDEYENRNEEGDEIKVEVPHDNSGNSTVIDDGPLNIVEGCEL